MIHVLKSRFLLELMCLSYSRASKIKFLGINDASNNFLLDLFD